MNPDLLPPRVATKVVRDDDGCWIWTAARDSSGYGLCWHAARYKLAHRVVYELLVGAIEPGLQLDHLCRVRECVNPEHLEPVTPRENVRRSATANTDLCRAGLHSWPDDSRTRPDARPICHPCEKAGRRRRDRIRRARMRALSTA